MAKASGVAEELFGLIVDYCEEIDSGSRTIEEPLGKNHPLIYFAGMFLEQFSAANCRQKIVGLSDRSSRQLLTERRRLRSRSDQPATQRLVYQLEKFCTQVGEISYSSSETDAEEFHLQYFALLLERIVAWLTEMEAHKSTRDAARNAASIYTNSVGL